MKVKRVTMLSGTHAVIHLSPWWLARLLGASDVVCELEWHDYDQRAMTKAGWYSVHSGRHLDYMPHSSLLERALEFQPLQLEAPTPHDVSDPPVDEAGVVSLPRARLLKEKG